MTLSIGLDAALSGLSTTADQTSVVSRNVARAGDAGASRKIANLVTLPGRRRASSPPSRASTNAALYDKLLAATSDAGAQQAIVDALNQLDRPSTIPSSTPRRRRWSASSPTPSRVCRSAAGRDRRALRGRRRERPRASAQRRDARPCRACARRPTPTSPASVDRVNTLLAQFETVNSEIVKGTRRAPTSPTTSTSATRSWPSISEEVGVRTVTRANNDMAIYTDSGVTLFDVRARGPSASTARCNLHAGHQRQCRLCRRRAGHGQRRPPCWSARGDLTGLVAVRDGVAVTYQNQLDEIARGLIEAFAESDQSAAPTLPDVPGLFTYRGAPAMPPAGSVLTGLAGTIGSTPASIPPRAATPTRLRDGGISGNPAYVYNATGASRLLRSGWSSCWTASTRTQAFDPAAQAAPSGDAWPALRHPRSPGCRRRASPPAPTPTTRPRSRSGPRRPCRRPPASTSTRR